VRWRLEQTEARVAVVRFTRAAVPLQALRKRPARFTPREAAPRLRMAVCLPRPRAARSEQGARAVPRALRSTPPGQSVVRGFQRMSAGQGAIRELRRTSAGLSDMREGPCTVVSRFITPTDLGLESGLATTSDRDLADSRFVGLSVPIITLAAQATGLAAFVTGWRAAGAGLHEATGGHGSIEASMLAAGYPRRW
jgi:hypothetical protein